MKTLQIIFIALLLNVSCLFGQTARIEKYFSKNLSEIDNKSEDLQEYNVTLKWQNLDAIKGNKINCNAVKANYIIGLDNDYVSWKNVSLSQIIDFNQNEFNGTDLPSFNSFTYQISDDTDFLKEDFYKSIPHEQRDLARWLVSDAIQMQGLALYVVDSLKFNEEFIPELLRNYDVKYKNWVTFSSRYQKLIWSGISKYNDEICAIIKFESLYNPIKIDNEQMSVEGRSLYYGEMWVSFADKQVEYAVMVEDVIMKLNSPAFPNEQLIDLQREIVFKKIDNQ